jgi:disulfide bond formation protein DsbB
MLREFDRRLISLLVLLGMAAVLATVLGYQHIGGYLPCKLCLQQRQPYYAAMPIAVIAVFASWLRWPRAIARICLTLVGLLLISSAALAVYHAGIEWQWWSGPADCGATAGNISEDVNDLLRDLTATRPPACDQAAGRFLGLSFAGWNVLASGALAAVAFAGAWRRER